MTILRNHLNRWSWSPGLERLNSRFLEKKNLLGSKLSGTFEYRLIDPSFSSRPIIGTESPFIVGGIRFEEGTQNRLE